MKRPSPPSQFMEYNEVINAIQQNNSINELRRNSFYLQRSWSCIKKRVNELLLKSNFSYITCLDAYPSICFHVNPNFTHHYVPKNDELHVNILTLLFHCNPSEYNRVFFNPVCIQTDMILHELDHYLYCIEHEIIGAPEEVIIEFSKKHQNLMEIRAYEKNVNFMTECKEIMENKSTYFYLSRDKNQTIKIGYTIESTNIVLDQQLKNNRKSIELISRSVNEYKQEAQKNAIREVKKIGDFFRIKLYVPKIEEEHDYVKINY